MKTSPSSTSSSSSRLTIFKPKHHFNNNNRKEKSKKSTNIQNSQNAYTFQATKKHQQPKSSKLKPQATIATSRNNPHNSELSYIVPYAETLCNTTSIEPAAASSAPANSNMLRNWSQSSTLSTTCCLETKHNYPNMDPNG